ncbi:retrovirus-related Pol polyprotein from transposon TNT 1-94 [Trichonephila clavipes]|uniref:Retrovirus-related Pol polyprotein from transposon TNT 1-94 n=1 Tax=Trichonephila clavipes TaxID=2585209 RepID=A0A8X6WL92_TRICX|nr:retrovirus-related Pol polyprotein from transposon TNT 1-94 [Trichonephila clavipes]
MKDYFDIGNVNNFTCETCDICKVTRKTHHSIDINQSSQILELLHANLCGPINIESFGGAKYFMVIVDDFSGMYFTYFLKSKYEVFNIFSQFKAKYENLTDERIKKIRTDNGLEFVNELDTYLANSGIFHEKTIPYNSESNGKAETANRVLLERARSLLYESKLPLKFWAEAVNCSTQVSNVTPQKGKEKIPLEIWTANRTRPDISFVTYYLSQFNHNPVKRHYNLAKRELRYLMGSKDKKIVLRKRICGVLNTSLDVSWGNADNGKSFSGVEVLLVRRHFHKLNIYGRSVITKPLVTDINAKRDLQWCHTHKTWSNDMWKKVVWSDESSFPTTVRVHVWRTPTQDFFLPAVKEGASSGVVHVT